LGEWNSDFRHLDSLVRAAASFSAIQLQVLSERRWVSPGSHSFSQAQR
jgi:hypothetical protein